MIGLKFPKIPKFRVPKISFPGKAARAPPSEYYNNYNTDQLREQARERGLSPAGNKRSLATRLAFNDMQTQQQNQTKQPQPQQQQQQVKQGPRKPDATLDFQKQQDLKLKRVSMTFEPLAGTKSWLQKRRK